MSIGSLMHEAFRVDVEAKRLNGEAERVIGEAFCFIDDTERLKWQVSGVDRCGRRTVRGLSGILCLDVQWLASAWS